MSRMMKVGLVPGWEMRKLNKETDKRQMKQWLSAVWYGPVRYDNTVSRTER